MAFDWSWKKRADLCIAQGALTNSKRPESLVRGVSPTHASKGRACYIYDGQGRRYVDYICGLGVNLIGYGETAITAAASYALTCGPSLSLSSTAEVEFAEKLKEVFPWVDLVKVLKTGSEACSA